MCALFGLVAKRLPVGANEHRLSERSRQQLSGEQGGLVKKSGEVGETVYIARIERTIFLWCKARIMVGYSLYLVTCYS